MVPLMMLLSLSPASAVKSKEGANNSRNSGMGGASTILTYLSLVLASLVFILVAVLIFLRLCRKARRPGHGSQRSGHVVEGNASGGNHQHGASELGSRRASDKTLVEEDDDVETQEIMNREGWTEDRRTSFVLAKLFERDHPVDRVNTEITEEQQAFIQEQGIAAWEFITTEETRSSVDVVERTELHFRLGTQRSLPATSSCCVQTNIAIPKHNNNTAVYFEVKILQLDSSSPSVAGGGEPEIIVGWATKPYPWWRGPGLNKYSLGYSSLRGHTFFNSELNNRAYGERLFVGDVVGCGYRLRSGNCFFTRNGIKYPIIPTATASLDITTAGRRRGAPPPFSLPQLNLFPTVYANCNCVLSVNFGQLGFVFIEANVKKWGFASNVGLLSPPPAYGSERNSILLESSLVNQSCESLRYNHSSLPPVVVEQAVAEPVARIPSSPPPAYTPTVATAATSDASGLVVATTSRPSSSGLATATENGDWCHRSAAK